MVSFYVYDTETGKQVSEFFNTFKQAERECKKISKNEYGVFSVSVVISSISYSNGILLED